MDLLTAAFAVIGFLCIIAFLSFFFRLFQKRRGCAGRHRFFAGAFRHFGGQCGSAMGELFDCFFARALCGLSVRKKLAFLFAGKDNDADEFPVWDEQEELAVMRENRPAALDWPAANDAVLPAEKSAPAPETKEILPGKTTETRNRKYPARRKG